MGNAVVANARIEEWDSRGDHQPSTNQSMI